MSRTSRVLLAGATVALAAGLVPLATAGATVGPAGNNGTVKIDGVDFDTAPNNEPHVGCVFQVDWYGFDAGVGDATVSFDLQAPTINGRTLTVAPENGSSGDLTPDIGEDNNAGGGSEAGIDHQETYRLLFTGEPFPVQQGYHVKLTVNNPGSIGADVKHKVFWVTGCESSKGPSN